jgi:cyd operon protein YbgT
MWYFAWVLGLAFASAFAILNAIWFEIHHDQARPDQGPGQKASLHRS